MSTPAISVIIPIYNVKKYLARCLESVRAQTFKDFEVILVNDGSDDGSADIAREFCKKDRRFSQIDKENSGQAESRNLGLRHARGDFVAFIDSDDYIREDYLEKLYTACVESGADMSYCRYKFYLLGIKIAPVLEPRAGVMQTQAALNELIRDNFLHSYPWNKLYRRSLFEDNEIEFPKMCFEDLATSSRLLLHANKLAVTDQYLYYYVKRRGSTMTTMNCAKINDYLQAVLIIRNYLETKGQYGTYRKAVRALAAKVRLFNIYSVIRQHLLNLDFHGMLKNLRTNKVIYKYIISDDYTPTDDIPALPCLITQPGKQKPKPGS